MQTQIEQYMKEHKKTLADFERTAAKNLGQAADMILECFKGGHILYLCGNGGSAADCQHIAGEFVGRFRRERKAKPAVALTTDSSVLSCIGNDYSYEDIFRRQVEGLCREGDVLWAFSTSGTSKNIIAAAKQAIAQGTKVIAFTGKKDSILEQMSQICVCAESQMTSIAQEMHQIAYHIICDIVESRL